MKQKLETIYETNIVHNSFLDKDSIIQAMVESYNLGKQELINWRKNPRTDDNPTGYWLHPEDVVGNGAAINALNLIINHFEG